MSDGIKTKPPLGLKPEDLWIHERLSDSVAAMDRYNYAGEEIPSEWFTELYKLLNIS